MPLVTANGVTVISGSVMRPLVGVWTADLVIDQADGTGFDPGTKVTITADGGYSLTGVVDANRTGDFLDAVHVRVIGGAGGIMSNNSAARSYVQPQAFVRDVISGLMSDSGETLSATTDAGFLATNLTAWSTIGADTVDRNIRVLVDIIAPSMSWRVLSDGTVWVGNESWPSLAGTIDIIAQDPTDGSYYLGVNSPFVIPGVSIDGVGKVARVQDIIESGKLRSRVWSNFDGQDRGANAAIQTMARQALPGVDFYATYVCQVEAQSADMSTVDVMPVGARNKSIIGGLQRVPVRFAAGVNVQMAPGSTVLLSWDGGDPQGPYVLAGLCSDTPITIQLGGGAQTPLINGLVLAKGIDPFTGLTYGVLGNASTSIMGKP